MEIICSLKGLLVTLLMEEIPNNPPGMYQTLQVMGYLSYQLVQCRISSINSMFRYSLDNTSQNVQGTGTHEVLYIVLIYNLGCPPSLEQSKGFPTKYVITLVVTVTVQGDNPTYSLCLFLMGMIQVDKPVR